MKIQPFAIRSALSLHESQTVAPTRYHIYRQARAGNYMLELKTDSAKEAVEMFAIMSPAYDGGEIHIWDGHLKELCASVEWHREATTFGFVVQNRRNVFFDPSLAALARERTEREAFRESILSSLRQSA